MCVAPHAGVACVPRVLRLLVWRQTDDGLLASRLAGQAAGPRWQCWRAGPRWGCWRAGLSWGAGGQAVGDAGGQGCVGAMHVQPTCGRSLTVSGAQAVAGHGAVSPGPAMPGGALAFFVCSCLCHLSNALPAQIFPWVQTGCGRTSTTAP
eukprot:6161-Chlamydomonas_euryale.AAC.1